MVAQVPAPRPPSPTARAATQKALRRENTNQLSMRDARMLMGLPSPEEGGEERARLTSFFASQEVAMEGELVKTPRSPAPVEGDEVKVTAEDTVLIEWANAHLPLSLQIRDATGPLCGGLALLRIAESVKGKPLSGTGSEFILPLPRPTPPILHDPWDQAAAGKVELDAWVEAGVKELAEVDPEALLEVEAIGGDCKRRRTRVAAGEIGCKREAL
ncbi:hypothetical protein DXG01_013458 [Tephrocybe rancida]|nr:hypothetical protein DXG01_013458 [Tephrocybe rancida]